MSESRPSGGDEAERARWRTALHESGHATACVAMDVPVRLVLIEGPGAGYCFHSPAPEAFVKAVIVAAGRRGEEYATTTEPPVHVDPRLPQASSPIMMELTRTIAETANDWPDTPDWVYIRDWACREQDFSAWTPRAERIHSLAARTLQLHMGLFIAIARELFVTGLVSEKRIGELAAKGGA